MMESESKTFTNTSISFFPQTKATVDSIPVYHLWPWPWRQGKKFEMLKKLSFIFLGILYLIKLFTQTDVFKKYGYVSLCFLCSLYFYVYLFKIFLRDPEEQFFDYYGTGFCARINWFFFPKMFVPIFENSKLPLEFSGYC